MMPSPSPSRRPARGRRSLPRLLAGILAGAALTALVAGCGGGDDKSSATAASRPGPGGGFAQLTTKQRACLKKQGVTLPSRPSGGQPPSGSGQMPAPPSGSGSGQPPTPPSGQAPPNGQVPPSGQAPQGGNSEQFQKLQKAFKACGVTMSGPGGAPPAQGTSGTGSQS